MQQHVPGCPRVQYNTYGDRQPRQAIALNIRFWAATSLRAYDCSCLVPSSKPTTTTPPDAPSRYCWGPVGDARIRQARKKKFKEGRSEERPSAAAAPPPGWRFPHWPAIKQPKQSTSPLCSRARFLAAGIPCLPLANPQKRLCVFAVLREDDLLPVYRQTVSTALSGEMPTLVNDDKGPDQERRDSSAGTLTSRRTRSYEVSCCCFFQVLFRCRMCDASMMATCLSGFFFSPFGLLSFFLLSQRRIPMVLLLIIVVSYTTVGMPPAD